MWSEILLEGEYSDQSLYLTIYTKMLSMLKIFPVCVQSHNEGVYCHAIKE